MLAEAAMSIRHGLLTLLAEGPSYGYQLRSRLEARTGGPRPLNIRQVHTTLSRPQREVRICREAAYRSRRRKAIPASPRTRATQRPAQAR